MTSSDRSVPTAVISLTSPINNLVTCTTSHLMAKQMSPRFLLLLHPCVLQTHASVIFFCLRVNELHGSGGLL